MSSELHNSGSLLRPFKQVFLCHSSLDTSRAKVLYGNLKDLGFRPWMDVMDLVPGQDWAFEITKAIEASAAMLVLLTSDSVRQLGYVETEIRTALAVAENKPKGTIFVIPIKLTFCDIPPQLKSLHWLDLSGVETGGAEKLVEALDRSVIKY